MSFLLSRLLEPSTWAGLTGLAVALGTAPDVMHELAQAGAALASLAAMALPENGTRRAAQAGGQHKDVSHQP
ncbi:hypothetical protein [Pandoraea bronchicola]|uniref:Uncharacterized protein n=1 Tax=Pandoraea bronchicola TaxID=2508287 RepID=A0A5E5BR10_9BURK|nr:hypothetical protein [Pandoraea bronchicola]VVE88064.1 hypothetical protein PBR20603_02009 [Pandoraea bronchicola]